MADSSRKTLQTVLIILIALIVVVLIFGGILLITRGGGDNNTPSADSSANTSNNGTASQSSTPMQTYTLPEMTGILSGSGGEYNPQDYEWVTIPAISVDYPETWTVTTLETKADNNIIDSKNGSANYSQGVTFTSPDGDVRVTLSEISGHSGGGLGTPDTPGNTFNFIANTGIPGVDVYEYIYQSGTWTYRSVLITKFAGGYPADAAYIDETSVHMNVGVRDEKGDYSSVDPNIDLNTPVMQEAIAIMSSLRWA